jgi:glycine cleavage system H protein
VSVKSPLSGTVLQINEALAGRPELVHLDPYGLGWLARLMPAAWDRECQALVHGAAVAEAMAHHARPNLLP